MFNVHCSMNRLRRLLIIGILTFVLVSACKSNAPQQISSQTDNTAAEAVRVVDHAIGKTKVPINPQRVVVLSDGLDTALSLGIKPVGSTQSLKEDDYLENRLEEIESVGTPGQPNLEAIVALKPDLILGIKSDNQYNYKLLSQIAPTVLAETKTNGDWQTILSQYAEALGKTDKAEQITRAYKARIEKFQAQMGDRLQETKVSIVNVRQDRIYVYLENTFCGKIVADAGLPRPSHQTILGNSPSIKIGKELLHKADGDIIFIWTSGSADSETVRKAQSELEQLKADPLWSKLNAVQQGKVYEVPGYWGEWVRSQLT